MARADLIAKIFPYLGARPVYSIKLIDAFNAMDSE